jgi:adenosylcobinamide-GDP ribazoletransferase
MACAVQFLTRLPTPRLRRYSPELFAQSVRYFPLAGELVGVIVAATWLMARAALPATFSAVLALAAGLLATGGLHEDGLADAADGLFGGSTREARLTIMKDSRIGAFGAMTLVMVLLAKVAALQTLGPGPGAAALLASHGLGRAAVVVVMRLLPYAGVVAAAKVKLAPDGVKTADAAVAVVLGLWPLLLWTPFKAAIALAVVILGAAILATLSRRAIGGVTGDVLGAVEQIAELAVLAAAVVVFPS